MRFCSSPRNLHRPLPEGRASAALRSLTLAGILLSGINPAHALLEGGATGIPVRIRPEKFAEDACRVIREEAVRRGLPPAYLARLIWKESAFSPAAVSPRGAQGIAQFMKGTAAERRLIDPFDPAPALAASAHYLADLRAQFGNLGLAAAAYNAGPTRVQTWLGGAGDLPLETQDYVHWITGHSAEEWSSAKAELSLPPVVAALPFDAACAKLATRALAPHVPATFRRAAGQASAAEAGMGIKRVKALEPGRVRVMIQIGGPAPAKAKPAKKKRR